MPWPGRPLRPVGVGGFGGDELELSALRSQRDGRVVTDGLAIGNGHAEDDCNGGVFTDIGAFIDEKLRILALYESEIATAPFPRSPETVRALAQVRGAAAGVRYAEAFQSIRESR